MQQFKVDSGQLNKGYLEIIGDEAHHLLAVLRLKEGEAISLFDGCGQKAVGMIEKAVKNCVTVRVTNRQTKETEPTVKVTLYQSLPKKDKLELVIQKATELGVHNIVPVESKRSIVSLTGEKVGKK